MSQPPPPDAGPRSPAKRGAPQWRAALVMSFKEFRRDNLTLWAAALTYYGVLSLFPGLLVLVATLGLLDDSLIVVLSGRLAERVGTTFGVGATVVEAWNVVKWPVLVVLVSLMLAILYRASPNAKQGGLRWVTPGGVVAVLLWIVVSFGFALYAANFASYDRTYGALGGVIVFLIWLWLSNLAILYGAELDAELERRRAIAAGHPPGVEPYMQVRDSRRIDPEADGGL